MKNNKGFSVVALIIILAILIGGGYAVWKKQTPAPVSTPTDGNSSTLSFEQLKNIQYASGNNYLSFPLKNGLWISGKQICSKSMCPDGEYAYQKLDEQKTIFGDINGDGTDDAIVVINNGWLCPLSDNGKTPPCILNLAGVDQDISTRRQGGGPLSIFVYAVLNLNGQPGKVYPLSANVGGYLKNLNPIRVDENHRVLVEVEYDSLFSPTFGTSEPLVRQKKIITFALNENGGTLAEIRNGKFDFKWNDPVKPLIRSVTPNSFSVGSKITVRGENFRFYENIIRLYPQQPDLLPYYLYIHATNVPAIDDGKTLELKITREQFWPGKSITEKGSPPVADVFKNIPAGNYLLSVSEDLLSNNKESNKIPITITSTAEQVGQITDWKTYRNDQYGFEFKYPSEWTVRKEEAEGFDMIGFTFSSVSFGVTIHTEEISEGQTLDKFLEIRDSGMCEGVPCRKVLDKKEIVVAGYPAIQRRESWSDCPCTGQATYFQRNNLVWIFSGEPINSSASITEKEEIMYNKIFSTFKFIK